MSRKAFTFVEIIIGVLIVSIIMGAVYKLVSSAFSSIYKGTQKMTNLRASSLILERLKYDVRCAIVPATENEQYTIEENEFSFYTTSFSDVRKKVTYKYENNELKRIAEGATRTLTAKVASFSIVTPEVENGNKYILVNIITDNELEKSSRNKSSEANKVKLTAVLYPRFFVESLTDEERYWYKSRENESY